jgi:aldehyde:ferredoxin oxidoreductase
VHGYHNRLLHIDVTSRATAVHPLSDSDLRRYVGGTGLGAWLLHRWAPRGVDPLAADNPLIFTSSPLVDTPLTTSSKYAITAKSPLTGCIGDSLSSSYLAIALKQTGFDAIVVTGRAEDWTGVVVDQDLVRFFDLTGLQGQTGTATEEALQAAHEGARFAAIGPAGERQVRYATICNDGGRQAGRTGTGAVMGSKRLKALGFKGHRPVTIADPAGLTELGDSLRRRSLGPATEKYRKVGTAANLLLFSRLGTLPTRNFQEASFEGAEALSGERLREERFVKKMGCYGCTIGCEHLYQARDGSRTEARVEYESLYALGPLLGIDDPDMVIRATARCNDLGLDTLSTGATIAWAMESAERGLLHDPRLRFGDGAGLLELLDLIAAREGIGALLAEGSRRAAAEVGGGSEAWAMHVKGLEMPGYDPRSLKTLALGLAVSTRGACHNRSGAYDADFSGAVDRFTADAGRGALAAESEDRSAVLDALVLCKFIRKCLHDFEGESAQMLRVVTGAAWTGEEVGRLGARLTTVKKLFNIREGWTHSDDTLPARVLDQPIPAGTAAGAALTRQELELMVQSYYAARGWTSEGLVPHAKLMALEVEELAGSPAR